MQYIRDICIYIYTTNLIYIYICKKHGYYMRARALKQVGRLLHERLQGGIPEPRPDHGLEFFDESDADTSDSGLSDILTVWGLRRINMSRLQCGFLISGRKSS